METPQEDESGNLLSAQCLDFIRSLTDKKIIFKFNLTSGSFSCSFDNKGAVAAPARIPTGARKKTPSTRKRNANRRRQFLERKKSGPPVDHESEPSANSGNLGSRVEAVIGGGDRDDEEVDGEVDEEGDGRGREQEGNVTIEDVAREISLWKSQMIENLSEIRKSMKDELQPLKEITANDPGERDGEVEESDGDAQDHLIEFADRLESGMRCFQRQVQTNDRKVQEARRKTTTTPQSPRKKRRRKR